tara:strand:+ start:731 stop:1027 length:297 start_codon:yes stop_codon:yes gene_type:complete
MVHFGNTSARSAFRLREGLIAFKNSGKEGQIIGKEGDQNFRDLLGNIKVVNLGNDNSFSVGRKWHSAMEKMGFTSLFNSKKKDKWKKSSGSLKIFAIN